MRRLFPRISNLTALAAGVIAVGALPAIAFAKGGLLDQLTGLSDLSWSDDRALLGFRHPLPTWLSALLLLVTIGFAWWSYSRLTGARWARIMLSGVRALLILAIITLICGPMLIVPDEQRVDDVLLVLVDRSESMSIADVADAPTNSDASPGARHAPISRDAALRAALAKHADLFGPDKLGKDRRILWLGFDSDTFEITEPIGVTTGDPTAAVNWSAPTGDVTALRTAIEQAMRKATGQPISGIVVFTDGRSSQPTGADLVRRLGKQAVPVFPVALGSRTTPLDLSITQVERPDKAFVNDTVPVKVYLDHYPEEKQLDPASVRVKLVDVQTGKTLDEQPALDGDLRKPILLKTESEVVGPVKWRVEVALIDSDEELITENNEELIDLELVDRAIRVLYVEGYPRWEYRYLNTMLVRETSIESSMLLASADQAFAQEGDIPITRLPRSDEEMQPYDVIMIGDVAADYFSARQLKLIRDQVSVRGAGLLWVAGERHTPRSYAGTALGALLPMRRPAVVHRADPGAGPVMVRPTAEAESLGVLQLRELGSANDAPAQWPESLPGLLWAQNIGDLKEIAIPLAEGYTEQGTLGALVTRMRYGAGRVIYVASDDTWRWRYGRGELYFEQFWTQLIRMLGRDRIQQDTGRVRLSLPRRRGSIDQPMVVTLTIEDALLLQRDLPRVAVSVMRREGEGPLAEMREVERLELLPVPDSPSEDADLATETPTSRVYRAIWRPTAAGELTLRVVEAAMVDQEVQQTIEIVRPDAELRHPAPDHARLEKLAEQTRGQMLELGTMERLWTDNLVKIRANVTPRDIREPLWDSYLALFVVVFLLTVEWIGRKVIKLV